MNNAILFYEELFNRITTIKGKQMSLFYFILFHQKEREEQ
jgi:hypothetical protein